MSLVGLVLVGCVGWVILLLIVLIRLLLILRWVGDTNIFTESAPRPVLILGFGETGFLSRLWKKNCT